MDIVRHLHNETMSEVNHQLICVNEIPSMPGRRNQYKIKGVMHGFYTSGNAVPSGPT